MRYMSLNNLEIAKYRTIELIWGIHKGCPHRGRRCGQPKVDRFGQGGHSPFLFPLYSF